MKVILALGWISLAAITWAETWLIRKARHYDYTNVALRERQIASVGRASALTLGAGLGINRLIGAPISERASQTLLSLALGLNAYPAARFLYLYWRGGFR